jgi:uncharacterized protein YuzE
MVTQEYDLDADALYLKLAEGTVARTVEVSGSVMVDEDAGGRLLGIDVLRPGITWPLLLVLNRWDLPAGDQAMLMQIWGLPPPSVSIA